MSGDVKYRGICSTCNNAETCKFPRDPDKAVFFCEEFEIEKLHPIKTTREERPQTAELYVAEVKDSTRFIGLCSDCGNCQTCVFPKSEGGVWHCEEYQ